MYEKLKERYEKFYITESQLDKYVALGVITQAESASIRAARTNEMEVNGNSGGGHFDQLKFRLPNGYHVILRYVGEGAE